MDEEKLLDEMHRILVKHQERLDALRGASETSALRLKQEARKLPPEDLADAASLALSAYLAPLRGATHQVTSKLPAHWRVVSTVSWLDAEVRNGGFHQYFTNGRGAYDAILVDDVRALGETPHLRIVEAAFRKYAGHDYEAQWKNLDRAEGRFEPAWETFCEGYRDERFEEEDQAYCGATPRLLASLGEYVREHFELFDDEANADPLDLASGAPKLESLGTSTHPAPLEHSLWRRLNWHPLVVAIPFFYLWSSAYRLDFPLWRTLAAGFVTIWFGMSVADLLSGHRLLDSLYAEDPED